jgi:hypothetical protein
LGKRHDVEVRQLARKACEVCMQEEGKERQLAEKKLEESAHVEEKSMQGQHARIPN